MSKLTDENIIAELKKGGVIRCKNMPRHVFLKLDKDRKRLFIEDWGQDMGWFQPTINAFENDDWYIGKAV